jgi:hypothetical protein
MYILGVYIDWTNTVEPIKSTQFNQNGLDNWMNMDFKNEKSIK